MSAGLLGLLAALAVLMLVTALAVYFMNRTPVIERDENEILPLFSGLGNSTVVEAERVEGDESAEPIEETPTVGPARPARTNTFGSAAYGPPPASASSANGTAAYGPPAPTGFANGSSSYAPPSSDARPNPSIRTFTTGAPAPLSVVGTAVERQSIQFSLPTEGTLQFLPGRLEINSGAESGREIRFVRLPGPNGTEFTFGRSEGEPYRHIQLRDQTVSRAHARMRFHEGRWFVSSLSHTNPVVLDGASLDSDEERALNDGARIEMGEVIFTFKNR